MSPSGFWFFNGYVQPLPCDVFEYVRQDINLLQASKIVATRNSAFSEIEWRYCAASSNEIDRCVVWNYQTGVWSVGRAARTCGVDKGVFLNPILIGADGTIYDHELGNDYDGEAPFAVSAPVELGNGDAIMHVLGLYPDDATAGDVTASFTVRRNPDDDGVAFGPYALAAKADLRFSGALVEVRLDGARGADWRVGEPRLDVMQGEGR